MYRLAFSKSGVSYALGDPKVYDADGVERDVVWLKARYGDFRLQRATFVEGARMWRITALREKRNAPAALVVRALHESGSPLELKNVAFYWPDADQDPNAGPADGVLEGMVPNRCVRGTTNAEGDVGFGMGPGAYYYPDRGEIGPHAVWMYGTETHSDLILGLGMLPGTNHDHFDVEFTRFDAEEPPPEPPDPGLPPGSYVIKIPAIEIVIQRID